MKWIIIKEVNAETIINVKHIISVITFMQDNGEWKTVVEMDYSKKSPRIDKDGKETKHNLMFFNGKEVYDNIMEQLNENNIFKNN